MILKGYPRISETFISNEILLLEELGFSVHIYSMRHPRESFSHESVKKIKARVDYLPETLLFSLPKFFFHNVLLAFNKPRHYAMALQTAFRRFLRTRKSATIKHLFQAGYLVHRLLPGSNVTHLHAHFAHSPTSVAMFASHLSGLSFSFTAHAKDIYTSDPKQLSEKIAMARFVMTCTEKNKQYLMNLSRKEMTPIHRVYHGIDTALFSNTQIKRPTPPYQILTVARMTAKKGLPTVYRALRHLLDMGIPIRHVCIGDGDEREQILSLIKNLTLNDIAHWLGTQPHHVVLEHYRRADLFVLGCEVASNGDRDGIPNVFLESMAMGVPVVSTNVSAIPELIENEKTGLLVSPGQPQQMAQAMARLLSNSDLRKDIIASAKHRVKRDFDNKRLIGDLAELLEAAVNSDR